MEGNTLVGAVYQAFKKYEGKKRKKYEGNSNLKVRGTSFVKQS